jgi:hypothetical protein
LRRTLQLSNRTARAEQSRPPPPRNGYGTTATMLEAAKGWLIRCMITLLTLGERTAWLRMQSDPNSSPLRISGENNRAKYRGESQKWVKNNDDILNKRRFHKSF